MPEPDDDLSGLTCGQLLRRFLKQARPRPDELQRRKPVSRHRTGLMPEELVERTGISDRGIRKIESGESTPDSDTVRVLSDALELSPEQRALFERVADRDREARDARERARRADVAASRRTNLPAPVSGFVGREGDIAAVGQALRRARLVTLVGAGGCGKTRLAITVATDVRREYPDGVWLIRLEALETPDALLPTVAWALGVREAENSLRAALIATLRRTHTLLLLDNCEHLLTPCAALAEALLEACPHLHILATSREALRLLSWEETWRVPSLALPPAGRRIPLDRLARYDAVQLFVRRAKDFVLTEENAPSVVRICRRLDGIPLAIELAAARLPILSAHELAERLDAQVWEPANSEEDDRDERFGLLTEGSRTAPPRQRTLAATMAWSYGLLSGPEQALLRRLAVFTGGWTIEAMKAVCVDGVVERGAAFSLLKLGTNAHFRGDHARATALLRESLSLYEGVGDMHGAADALDYLAYTAMSYPDADDPRELFERSLSLSRQMEEPERMASVRFGLAGLAFFAGEFARARALVGESLALYRALGLTAGVAMPVEGCAALAVVEGHGERAARLFAAADTARGHQCPAPGGLWSYV